MDRWVLESSSVLALELVSDLVGQLVSSNGNWGAVNWGSVVGATLGGGLASYGARNTIRIGEALGASRWTREWAAALIGVGPSIGVPLLGAALWTTARHDAGTSNGLLPGTTGGRAAMLVK